MTDLAWRRFERRLVTAHAEADPPLSPEIWRGVEAALAVRRPRRDLWLGLGALALAAAALVVALLPPRPPTPTPAPTLAPLLHPPQPAPAPSPPTVLNGVLQTRRPVTFTITADAARIEIEPCRGRFVNVTVLGGPHRVLELTEQDRGRRVEPRFDGQPVLTGGVAHILLPADTHLVISTRSGPVVVRGLGGPMEIDTQSGEVRLDTAPRLDPVVTVTTDGGAITWSGRCGRRCAVDARSRAGDITLRAPSRAAFHSGAARAESATGHVYLEELACIDSRCSSSPLPWRQPAAGKRH